MIRVATADDIAWAAGRIGIGKFREDAKGLSLVANDGSLKGVAVFDTWSTADAHIHIASDGTRRWLNRQFVVEVFYYAFVTAGLRRLTGVVPERNRDALRFDMHLGFTVEGRCEDALPDDHAIILGMKRANCRFLPAKWRAS